eukprot:1155106-Pelagomonas_calceolata.AAC.1
MEKPRWQREHSLRQLKERRHKGGDECLSSFVFDGAFVQVGLRILHRMGMELSFHCVIAVKLLAGHQALYLHNTILLISECGFGFLNSSNCLAGTVLLLTSSSSLRIILRASKDIVRADRLALQDLQIPEHATNGTLPEYIFPHRFPDKDRLTSSWPDVIPDVGLMGARGEQGGLNASHSHSTQSKARHPSQLLPDQRHVHLVEVKYCEDTRPKSQPAELEASKQQHRDLCCHLSRTSAQVTLHIILLVVGGVIYTPHTLKPLKELGLDTYKATKLAQKLHAHSVQYAYKVASTRQALEKTSFNSHQHDQARAAGCCL